MVPSAPVTAIGVTPASSVPRMTLASETGAPVVALVTLMVIVPLRAGFWWVNDGVGSMSLAPVGSSSVTSLAAPVPMPLVAKAPYTVSCRTSKSAWRW